MCKIKILTYNFVETPHKFIITKLSIHELGSLSVLIISSGEGPSLWNKSFSIINLHSVSTKIIFKLGIHHANLQGN